MVRIRSVLTPESTRCKRQKLLVRSPALINSMTASESSVTTSRLCQRLLPVLSVVARPLSFNASSRLNLVVCHLGASPNSSPVTTETSAVQPSTRPSMPTWLNRGIVSGAIFSNTRTPTMANSVPNAPPVRANKVLSVRSCRMMRERLAPSAVRSDISLTRAAERTSMRLATLTAAIQQYQRCRRHKNQQSQPHIAQDEFAHRQRIEVELLTAQNVLTGRIARFESAHFDARALQAHIFLQSRHACQEVRAASRRRFQLQCRPQ